MHRTKHETPAVRRTMRRYYWAYAPAMALFVFGTMLLFVSEDRSLVAQLAMAAIPIVGVIWLTFSLVVLYRRSDERSRMHMLKGAAAGFAIGIPALAVSGLVFSFLDEPPGRPSLMAVWIPLTIGMAAWAIGWVRSHRGVF